MKTRTPVKSTFKNRSIISIFSTQNYFKSIGLLYKTLLILVVFLINIFSVNAQAKLEFNDRTFDFGVIKEVDGIKSGKFIVKNAGNQPLLITGVRPSCGCTVSKYTTEEIAPGQTGYIEATFDPANRPGPFNKSISVTSNDPLQPTAVIFIKGDVIKRPPTKADNFPTKLGNLRLTTNHLSFSDIKITQRKTDTIKLYNETPQTIEILSVSNLPPFLNVEIPIRTLKPEQEGFLIITYDAVKRDDFGFLFDSFNLLTNDNLMPEKLIYVSANISPDFSHLSPKQLANAPKFVVEEQIIDFGTVKPGAEVKVNYIIRNEGRDPLNILRIKPSCGCTVGQVEKNNIKGGETTKLPVTFTTTGRNGFQYHNIVLFTNDPNNPSIILILKGNIVP